MGLAKDTLEKALAMMRSGKPGCINVTDDKGNVRMQVTIPRAYKSTGTCKCCGEPLYCDHCMREE